MHDNGGWLGKPTSPFSHPLSYDKLISCYHDGV
jgi:hypothetical protein